MVTTRPGPALASNRWLYLPTAVMVRTLWQERPTLLITTLVSAIVGALVAWILQPEFRSEARIMPEMNNGANTIFKRLSSVAGFSDVDFSDAESLDAIRPDLYPNVLQSTPFILYLIDQAVTQTDGQLTTVGQFLLTHTKGWALTKLLSFPKTDEDKRPASDKMAGPVRLSAQQQDLADDIGKRVSAKLDTRSGIITITATMPDANLAAAVAQSAMNYLTDYVTSYRTEKARQDLHFYSQRLAEAQKRYYTSQFNVFHYNDNHKSIVMQASTMDRHRMEAELTIAQTVYTELSRQLEQAKLKVQERTPIFKVLEPPKVPLKRTSPKRTIVVAFFGVTGLLGSSVYILARQVNVWGRLKVIIEES